MTSAVSEEGWSGEEGWGDGVRGEGEGDSEERCTVLATAVVMVIFSDSWWFVVVCGGLCGSWKV